jgi:hypothetical protein
VRFPWGREAHRQSAVWTVSDDDPARASVEAHAESAIDLPGRSLEWSTDINLRSDASLIHYRCRRELREGGAVVRERVWEEDVPRDFQ